MSQPAAQPSSDRPAIPLDVIATALFAPEPAPENVTAVISRLRELVRLTGETGRLGDAVASAAARLRAAASSGDRSELQSALEASYGGLAAAAEDIFLLRAAGERPDDAAAFARARRYLDEAPVADGNATLRIDHAIADEQASYATPVIDAQRVPTALAAFAHFHRQYAKSYAEHHARYWLETARLSDMLRDARPVAQALARLNSLTELGPPVGEGALRDLDELLRAPTECALEGDLRDELAEHALCPGCSITLDATPPSERVADVVSRVKRAVRRQIARLSSVAVRQTLERSTDPRVERFLRVVEAAHISSLAEVLDDQLTNYLRRFLIESQLNSLLEPLLDDIESGQGPPEARARAAFQQVGELLERAVTITRRALPSGEERPKRQGKRRQ